MAIVRRFEKNKWNVQLVWMSKSKSRVILDLTTKICSQHNCTNNIEITDMK